MLSDMPHLRLVPVKAVAEPTAVHAADDRPRVSLRLLMAASGRCACDDCLLAFRAGNKSAGIVAVATARQRISAVR